MHDAGRARVRRTAARVAGAALTVGRLRRGRFPSQTVRVAGGRVHALVSPRPVGSHGPAIVLIHGLAGTSGFMMRTARRLAPQHEVLSVDLPGHGRSAGWRGYPSVGQLAEGVGAWLAGLAPGRVVLVGASFGSQVVVELAVREPDLVDRVVLVGPTPDPAVRSAAGLLGRLAVDATREPAIIPAAARGVLRAGPRRVLATIDHLARDPVEAKLPRLAAPVLVVRGARDPVATAAWCRHVVSLLPDARLVELPGAAHAVNYSAPAALADAIRRFLPAPSLPVSCRGDVR